MTAQGRRINVRGTVDAITYPGYECEPVVTVMLGVGDQELVLSFLGRTDLHSVNVGAVLHVKGTLTSQRGVPTVFDPAYTVITN